MDHRTFTEQYLAIIRDTLQPSETNNGQLSFDWDRDSADELARRLENHFDVNTGSAIESARERAEDNHYSYHFGHSPNLNETLKYAPLYTDHVVLQDIVYRTLRARHHRSDQQIKKSVLTYVENIVQWEPLIKGGHLSILPSPHLWSEPIREYLEGIESGAMQICTQPLLATDRLNTNPFTDAEDYSNKVKNLALAASELIEAAETSKIDLVQNNTWGPHETTEETRVLSVGSQMFGTDGETGRDLYYLPDASYEEVIELATEFEGFRSCYNDIITDLVKTEGGEVEDLVAQAPEKIESDYDDIKQRLQLKKETISAAGGIAGLAVSLPLFVNVSPEDILRTSYLMSSAVNWEQLIESVIAITSGASGGWTLQEISRDLISDEHDFDMVMSELERASVNNSHVKSLRPV